MSQDFFTIDQVAERLNLHVKTVRQFVRDGRLKGVRLGKQYRIAREDLEAFTGQPLPRPEPVRRTRSVEVSTIVRIEVVSPEQASRLTTLLISSLNGRGAGEPRAGLDTVYDETRATLKVIITADLATTVGVMRLLDLFLEA
jgi:excisionase family DNA binding protein